MRMYDPTKANTHKKAVWLETKEIPAKSMVFTGYAQPVGLYRSYAICATNVDGILVYHSNKNNVGGDDSSSSSNGNGNGSSVGLVKLNTFDAIRSMPLHSFQLCASFFLSSIELSFWALCVLRRSADSEGTQWKNCEFRYHALNSTKYMDNLSRTTNTKRISHSKCLSDVGRDKV